MLAGGVAVLSAVFETLGLDEMRPARGALRVGLLYDLLGRHEQKDLRDSTVERMLEAVRRRPGPGVARRDDGEALYAERAAAGVRGDDTSVWRWAACCTRSASRSRTATITSTPPTWCSMPICRDSRRPTRQHIATLVLAQRGNLKKVDDVLRGP